MSASFASASTQRLGNSVPPITTYPFTVAMWVFPLASTGQLTFWSLADTAGDTNSFDLRTNNTSWSFVATAGSSSTTSTGTVTVSKWGFVVVRAISATNRRLAILHFDGSAAHAQTTASRAPAGVDNMSLGALVRSSASQAFDGFIGEFWFTDTDIQTDGAQMQNALLRQLAYGGPFSVPHIAKDIVEYRALRVHPDSRGDQPGEVFHGKFGRQTWSNTNGVTIGPHPPLPYWYVKPGQTLRPLMV